MAYLERPPQGRHLYRAARAVAGLMKGSLHASGRCHFAVTTQHYDKISAGAGEMLPERRITAWERLRPSPINDVALAVSIYFAAELLSEKPHPVEPGTRLIGTPAPGKAIIVDFLFGIPAVGQLLLYPNQTDLGRVTLSNGELFLIIAGLVDDFYLDRFRRQMDLLRLTPNKLAILEC